MQLQRVRRDASLQTGLVTLIENMHIMRVNVLW